MNDDLKVTIYQAMGTCLMFIIAFVAYGVHLRRKERRQLRQVKDVMWKKPARPGISPVKEYKYDEPKPIANDKITPTNRAERRKEKQRNDNSSHTVNWAD